MNIFGHLHTHFDSDFRSDSVLHHQAQQYHMYVCTGAGSTAFKDDSSLTRKVTQHGYQKHCESEEHSPVPHNDQLYLLENSLQIVSIVTSPGFWGPASAPLWFYLQHQFPYCVLCSSCFFSWCSQPNLILFLQSPMMSALAHSHQRICVARNENGLSRCRTKHDTTCCGSPLADDLYNVREIRYLFNMSRHESTTKPLDRRRPIPLLLYFCNLLLCFFKSRPVICHCPSLVKQNFTSSHGLGLLSCPTCPSFFFLALCNGHASSLRSLTIRISPLEGTDIVSLFSHPAPVFASSLNVFNHLFAPSFLFAAFLSARPATLLNNSS